MTADLTSQHPNLVVREMPKVAKPAADAEAAPAEMPAETAMDMPDTGTSDDAEMHDAMPDMANDMAKDMAKDMPAEIADAPTDPVVGFLVVVAGPGKGSFAPLFDGVNDIGSGPDRMVSLAFGDDAISPESHAIVVYDARAQMFQLNHTGQRVVVRHNGASVLGPVALDNGDEIEISKTTLRFVQLCGKDFAWPEEN